MKMIVRRTFNPYALKEKLSYIRYFDIEIYKGFVLSRKRICSFWIAYPFSYSTRGSSLSINFKFEKSI